VGRVYPLLDEELIGRGVCFREGRATALIRIS
jgi:hypothetical protein